MTTSELQPTRVLHRTGQWCPGLRQGDVVMYEMRILPPWQVPGRPTTDRSFLLLSEGVQLTRPGAFTGPLEGAWYVDLVDVETVPDGLVVHDRYVDLLILPTGRRYEILDLDELGDAMTEGMITLEVATTVLRHTQDFIDRHLRDDAAGPSTAWPDFPPRAIVDLAEVPPLLDPQ